MSSFAESWELVDKLHRAADPATVSWVAFCLDCQARSDRTPDRQAASFWRLGHALQRASWEHRIRLVLSFRLPGGTKTFEVVVA